MKQCPTCNRTYADETLTYCLADGSLLSAPYDAEATQRIPASRPTSPSATEVLPSNPASYQPTRRDKSPLLIYFVIGLLALLAGGVIVAWIKSDSNTSFPAKSEVSSNVSSSTEQKESLQEEQAKLESERQKLADERKKLEAKAAAKESESNSPATKRLPQPSSGTWFVILGSYPKNSYEKANQRLQYVQASGYDASIIDTDNYPGLGGGLWAVVMGPYAKSDAKNVAAQMKSVRSDVYIKSGW